MILFYVVRYSDDNLEVFTDHICKCGSNKRYSKCCYEKEKAEGSIIVDRVVIDNEGKKTSFLAEQVVALLKRNMSKAKSQVIMQ